MAYELFGINALDWLKVGGSAAVVGGGAMAWARNVQNRILNREFDTWLVSFTSVSAPHPVTGKRLLVLDNIGSPERFDDAVRGREERKAMSAAAKDCSWQVERRFLLARKSEQDGILHVTRNAMTKHFIAGVRAKMAGKPVTEHVYYFAVTGSDAAHHAKKKYRVIVMTEADMELVLTHPADMWDFDDETHAVRLETCRAMATAHRNKGIHVCDGVDYKVVGWFRAYEPVTA